MPRGLTVYAGRLKKFQFVWRQGSSPTSPPLDLTNATVTIQSHNLTTAPTVAILNALTGTCELTFPAAATKSIKPGNNPHSINIALTYNANAGYSPDPVRIEVDVL